MPEIHCRVAIGLFRKRDYASAWRHVHEAQRLGYGCDPGFPHSLRQAMPEPKEPP